MALGRRPLYDRSQNTGKIVVKSAILKPLERITHSRKFITSAQCAKLDQVLRAFKHFDRTDYDKLAVILRVSHIATRGPNREKVNSICFQIDGVCVSIKLLLSPEARIAAA